LWVGEGNGFAVPLEFNHENRKCETCAESCDKVVR
jgi:hypothetical protein